MKLVLAEMPQPPNFLAVDTSPGENGPLLWLPLRESQEGVGLGNHWTVQEVRALGYSYSQVWPNEVELVDDLRHLQGGQPLARVRLPRYIHDAIAQATFFRKERGLLMARLHLTYKQEE